MYLLNKNIAQLRWHCDETTPDLKGTLRNLDSLLGLLTTREPLSSPSARLNLPHAPPVLSGVATYLSRGTPPGKSRIFFEGENPKDLKQSYSLEDQTPSPPGDETPSPPGDQNVDLIVSDSSEENLKLMSQSSPHQSNSNGHEPNNPNSEENGKVSEKSDGSGSAEEVVDHSDFNTEPASEELFEEQIPDCHATCSGSEDGLESNVEIGVAADIFWDSVTSRAQVLSVPASFKTNKQKTFRKF